MNNSVSSLVKYYLEKDYINKYDIEYCTNQVAALLNIKNIEYNDSVDSTLYNALEDIIDYAVKSNVINNYVYEKEILEAKITNVFLDKPSIVQTKFENTEIEKAYTDFYHMCVDSNYIKKKSLSKNISYTEEVNNKPINISINLAKPEKDPKEIEMQKNIKSASYPKCPLCIENVGFEGSLNNAARSNLRVIDLKLNNQDWFFQYSPYSYYDYHCILIEKIHEDMKLDDNTIKVQFDFIDKFKNFFIGNNAPLPIVGGSILNHNHFQGGKYTFPINNSRTVYEEICDEIKIEYLDWYLTSIRLTSTNREKIIKKANYIKNNWLKYTNKDIKIENCENNSVNFICCKRNDEYEVIIILRNNATSKSHPSGIFHTNEKFHHLKRENIGLIEAMGLAILPGRLVEELAEVQNYILSDKPLSTSLHKEWADMIKSNYNNEDIEKYLKYEVAKLFVEILKCCEVLKYTDDKVAIIKKIIL